jgi:hypothetical protein
MKIKFQSLRNPLKVGLNIIGLSEREDFQLFYRISVIVVFGFIAFLMYVAFQNFARLSNYLMYSEMYSVQLWVVIKGLNDNFLQS